LELTILMAYSLGLITGAMVVTIPDLIKHYSFKKHLSDLGDERPEDPPEDPDDEREREKREEAEIGFF
jgi:hypothetical protein